jgi:hypothetical protein
MNDATAAEMRRVLKEHGHEIGDRGKLSADHEAAYERIVAGHRPGPASMFPAAAEYDAGVTEADFAEPDGPEDYPAPGPGPGPGPGGDGGQGDELEAERTPRAAPRQPRPGLRERAERARGRGRRKARASAARKRTADRIPTGPFIERAWTELAQAARKIPPMQRVMAAQAPMVGVVLGDAARDTFVEPMLQWAARGEERLEAVNGVFGPLLWTGLILRFGGFEVEQVMRDGQPVIDQDGNPLVRPVMDPETGQPDWNDQTRVMLGGLRMSLMSWIRISQRHAAEIIARAEEMEELGAQADALIAFILAPPQPRQSFRDMAREARQRAGVFVQGEAEGEPEGWPGDPRGAHHDDTPAPAPAAAGQAPGAAPDLGSHPYGLQMDPRTLGFMPPDEYTTSQVVPRAALPQA